MVRTPAPQLEAVRKIPKKKRKLLGTHKLRNLRSVYNTDLGFEVAHHDRRGTEHVSKISQEVVEQTFAICMGETLTADDVSFRLQPYAKKLGLQYHYGWRLSMFVREILSILDVTNRLSVTKQGNTFRYRFE